MIPAPVAGTADMVGTVEKITLSGSNSEPNAWENNDGSTIPWQRLPALQR
jgi:hypothetical protein